MMSRHLALVADNSRPSLPKPGYREALAAGACQQCGRKDGSVRTAGLRRPDRTWFNWVALCASCVAEAGRQGYPVVAAVRAPVPPEMSSGLPDMPDPEPVHRYPVTVAGFAGKCPDCAGPVAVGEMITRGAADDGKWRHARCAEPDNAAIP
jgi:hypothetical protein